MGSEKNRTLLPCLLLIFILALGVRAYRAFYQPLWVDEAESAINALTILDHGVPVDRYLGMPIYENTLVRPWPGNPEYEFKDLSYSDRGLAIYHGWLPLYAMAGSLALFGIHPDHDTVPGPIRRDLEDFRLRSFAARFPSLLFSLLMLGVLYRAGREMFGEAAAWAALVTAGFADNFVWLGCQARYYSATLLLVALCLLLIHRIMTRGRWRDFLGFGAAAALLFHVHLLSFAIACTVLLLMAPFWMRAPRAFWKASACGLIVLASSLPWLLGTGYLRHLGEAPAALPLLVFPQDLFRYLDGRWDYAAVFAAILTVLIVFRFRPGLLPAPLRAGMTEQGRAILLILAWIVSSFLLFIVCMPAASFFMPRLSLPMVPAGALLLACAFNWAALWIRPGNARLVAPLLALGFLILMGRAWFFFPDANREGIDAYAPVEALNRLELTEDTRLYAAPNDHLVITYCTGLPFQSIAPVRKSFLDRYEGPIVLVEKMHQRFEDEDPLGWEGLQEIAGEMGVSLSQAEAEQWSRRLVYRIDREDESRRSTRLIPPLEEIPGFAEEAVSRQRRREQEKFRERNEEDYHPVVFRGHELTDWADWWKIFFYRFVNPESRMGPGLNYGERMRHARAIIEPGTRWKVYYAERQKKRNHIGPEPPPARIPGQEAAPGTRAG